MAKRHTQRATSRRRAPRWHPCRDVIAPVAPSPEIQKFLIDVYRDVYERDLYNSELCERLVDQVEGLEKWRYRHGKMVERTIGTTSGTGGSSGVPYLRTTVGQPAFPEL